MMHGQCFRKVTTFLDGSQWEDGFEYHPLSAHADFEGLEVLWCYRTEDEVQGGKIIQPQEFLLQLSWALGLRTIKMSYHRVLGQDTTHQNTGQRWLLKPYLSITRCFTSAWR